MLVAAIGRDGDRVFGHDDMVSWNAPLNEFRTARARHLRRRANFELGQKVQNNGQSGLRGCVFFEEQGECADGRVAARGLDGRMRGRCLGEPTPQENPMLGKIGCCLGRLAVVIAGAVALGFCLAHFLR